MKISRKICVFGLGRCH